MAANGRAPPGMKSLKHLAPASAKRFRKAVRFDGVEAGDALLSDATRAFERYGRPSVTVDRMIQWISDWIERDGATLGKPTHFETRDGKF